MQNGRNTLAYFVEKLVAVKKSFAELKPVG